MKWICCFVIGVMGLSLVSCSSKDDPKEPNKGFGSKEQSLVVVNAGNFTRSNSSLTVWDDNSGNVEQNVFASVNGFKLGDLAQSATVHDGRLWVVVNNSNVIFALDTATFKEKGRIDSGIGSPRYIHFVSKDKAYVSQMYSNKIAVVDPMKYKLTGYIDMPTYRPSDGSTEEMVQVGDYVYVTQWSYGKAVVKIDSRTDEVVGAYLVGIQPYSIVKDYKDDLWTLCDGGGWEENPAGYEAPTLVELNLHPTSVGAEWDKDRTLELPKGSNVSKLCTNGIGTRLYFLMNSYDDEGNNTGGVYMLDVTQQYLSLKKIVPAENRTFYSMTVSPNTEEIFVADALDYEQNGVIYHYSAEGRLLGKFEAGIIPTGYAWILK